MFITRPSFYNQIVEDCLETLDPVYTKNVDTIPVLMVFKK